MDLENKSDYECKKNKKIENTEPYDHICKLQNVEYMRDHKKLFAKPLLQSRLNTKTPA